jgi:hypothetical protein
MQELEASQLLQAIRLSVQQPSDSEDDEGSIGDEEDDGDEPINYFDQLITPDTISYSCERTNATARKPKKKRRTENKENEDPSIKTAMRRKWSGTISRLLICVHSLAALCAWAWW